MADEIYIVNPKTKEPCKVRPVAFSDIGIKERNDLQEWIIRHPAMLGEELLVITSEFDRFDKSKNRLDVLAFDQNGLLVVIELKLDANRTLADLQAIRYAAFCSTMTIDDIIELYMSFHDISLDDARTKICEFVKKEELPDLTNHPRIILAAGIIDDQELTSSVLWLRKVGVDISCVELTPYKLPNDSQIILVPKVIIPIPEAKEYVVAVERKEAKQAIQNRELTEIERVGQAIVDGFDKFETGFEVSSGRMRSGYMQVRLHHSWIHYEWLLQKRKSQLEVVLHFESSDIEENKRLVEKLLPHEKEIKKDIPWEFVAGTFGKKWARVGFCISLPESGFTIEIAPEAARVMKILIERTFHLVEPFVKGKQ